MIEAETANMLSQWVSSNLDIVFFIYGFAFVVMGLAIMIQTKKGSEFPLANILWLLAGFGITHGINEFLDMWAIIRGRHPALDMVRWFILVASYVFMFEFGRRLLKIHSQITHQWHRKIAELLVWWLSSLISAFILISGFMSSDFWKTGSIWTRYLLGFPGGLLIGFGFLLCSCHDITKELKLRKYFWTGSASFLVYGVLGGLVVPKGDFFPSSSFNSESFLAALGMPVQVFRAICAVTAAWAVGGMLKIFNWETRKKLEEARDRLERQLSRNTKLTDNVSSLHEISKELLTESDVERLLKKIADNARKLIGCRYSAIGIINDKGGYKYFIPSGMDPELYYTHLREKHGLPCGKGLLDYFLQESNPLRLDDISKHPASAGFPAGHPEMKTFLGVPVKLTDRIIGRLYFTDKHGGEIFTEEDENLAISYANTVSLALNNAEILEAVRRSEKSLDEAQRLAHLGNWEWDIVNNKLRWSDEIYRVFGLNPGEFGATSEAFLSYVHPYDRKFVTQAVNEALYEGKPYSIDHRIVLPDGTGRIVHEQAEVTFDKANKPVRMIGTVQDITEQKIAEEKIKKNYQIQNVLNSLLHISLEDVPIGKQLEHCLDVILSAPFLTLLPKGGIFLVEDETDTLLLKANRRLPVPLQGICAKVPFGRCLCGRAAASRKVQFAACLDDRHDNRYEGLTPHGHYTVPILSKGKTLGVFVLYLQEGHQQKEEEVMFLQTVADTLAGIIERKEVEEELERYTTELMELAESSNVIGAIVPTEDIYEAICNIAVRNFDLKMAWIGLIEDGSYYVTPLAQSGFEEGYLSDVIIKWDDSPEGMGPTGMAVKTRIPQAMHNIDADPAYAPWKDKALKRGYKSSLSIPLINSEAQVFGVLNLYSSEPRFFTKKTVRLFITFANHAVSAIENRQLIEGLEEKIKDRTKEVDEARMQAESANRAKSDFLSNMSHEMRTPLGAIIGFSEMMKEGFAGKINAQQSEYLGKVINASNQLLSLINDLLDLAKIEAGKMELDLKEFNLGELLETSLAMFNDKALKHNLKLGLDIGEGTEKVTADAAKIRQIMLNLLGNAVKFTPEGGSVHVRARGGQNFIEISVADTGIGISEEDREKLFQPFQQLDSVLTKKYKGTGLGLSICKRLVELHEGKIWIEGLEGGGSRFSFVIPANRVEKHHSVADGVRKT
jgi:PAS domain S-box-containing protein